MTRATPAATVLAGPTAAPAPAPTAARRRRAPGRAVGCAALTAAAFLPVALRSPAGTGITVALSVVVVVWGGAPAHRGAWAGLRRGALPVDVLPAAGLLAMCGAAMWGTVQPLPFATAAAATTLLLAGRHVQERAVRRAATALDDASPTETVQPAEEPFTVGPGEPVTVSAVVVEGRSAIELADAAAPVEVGVGDPVPAGARNAGNRLVLRAAHPSRPEGAASGPGRPEAEARRGAAVARALADRAAGGFACVVVALAVAVLGFWLGAGAGPAAAVGSAAAVLLAACPGAAGVTVCAALLAVTARAGELGGLFAAPRVLERAARVDTVVLCRTGTVTTGIPRLRTVHVAEGVDADEALRLAGAVAAAARESACAAGCAIDAAVATVIAPEAGERFGELPGVAEFDRYPGIGVRGVVTELCTGPDGGQRVIAHATLLGHAALLEAHGIALPPELAAQLETAHDEGSTAVAVSWDGVARAVLEIDDPVRPAGPEAVRRLRELGITPVLLTGDDTGAARGLAAVLGVDPGEVIAEVGPDRRAATVAGLRARGRTVAVLGGPAEAAALTAADVPLVHGTPGGLPTGGPEPPAGSVPSGDLAGVVLRDDDPLTAVDALRVARRAVRTVQRVLVAIVAYHLAALPLAATGLLPPVAAAAAAVACGGGAVACAVRLSGVRPLARPTAS
jgi:P-type Cu+ transporter